MPENRSTPDRIGVFGSAFNPPQMAHLSLVEQARGQLGLDRIVIVPTGDPYHKAVGSDPGPETRFRLAEAAFGGLAGTTVSRLEVDRDGPSYTYVTVEQIAGDNPDSEIHLLMGADTASGFGDWKRPERILELARVAVAERPGARRDEVKEVFERLGGADRIVFIGMSESGVSSSLVRERIAAGLPVEDLVPPAVGEMINNEGVYGSEQ